jgi:predicted HAD superfamily Cof-like phosphohydrolase
VDDIIDRVEAQYDDGHVDVRLARELVAEVKRLRVSLHDVVEASNSAADSAQRLITKQRLMIRQQDEIVRLNRASIRSQVSEFHRAFGQDIADKPSVPDDKTVVLRVNLIAEEFCEMLEAVYGDDDGIHAIMEAIKHQVAYGNIRVDMVDFADALADLDYVAEGARLTFGIDGAPIAAEVHRSNMAKLGPDGKPIIREDGKRLKPPGWTPPDIDAELKKQGW